jgi:hypothetical protein
VQAFRSWIKKEIEALDWQRWRASLALGPQPDESLITEPPRRRERALRGRR